LGLVPGARVNASHIDGRVFLVLEGQENGLALDHDLAAHIFVDD
jgi:hypothetical protein